MKEILTLVMQFLILSIFIGLLVFYGLVFWHWRNDGKTPRYEARELIKPGRQR
jgi:hypothetical protein